MALEEGVLVLLTVKMCSQRTDPDCSFLKRKLNVLLKLTYASSIQMQVNICPQHSNNISGGIACCLTNAQGTVDIGLS